MDWHRALSVAIALGAGLLILIAASLLGFQLVTVSLASQPTKAPTEIQNFSVSYPSTNGMTSEILFSKLLEQNRLRELRLAQHLVARTYLVKNDKNEVRAESQVLMQYWAPATKEFKIVSEKGSGAVRRLVFEPLLKSEVEAASGHNKRDSSITPANYSFKLLGEEDVGGHHCFIVEATPKRRDKYLFEGKIWIEASEFAIVRIAGRPAKNPSFWIKRVDFVRHYKLVIDS